ncbi:MAG: tetratricopeptide repeat protein [Pirellula sp.]
MMSTVMHGIELENRDDWRGAEAIYQEILKRESKNLEAWFRLGSVSLKLGNHPLAVESFQRCIEIDPSIVELWSNLGYAFASAGSLDSAARALQRAVQMRPDRADLRRDFGYVLRDLRQFELAGDVLRSSLSIDSQNVDVRFCLADVLKEKGNLVAAINELQEILNQVPTHLPALMMVSHLHCRTSRFPEAIAGFQRAIQLAPTNDRAHFGLGNAYYHSGRFDDAIVCFRRSLELNPECADAYSNLGIVLCFHGSLVEGHGKLDEAITCFQQAIRINPRLAEAHNGLANALKSQGEIDEAISCYRRALEIAPDWSGVHSNLVYMLTFSDQYDAKQIYDENRIWNMRFGEPLRIRIEPHSNFPTKNRRLKIGYVSPDFRANCLALFTTPVLSSHDHENFEVYCYSDVVHPDHITHNLRSHADHWRDVVGNSLDEIARIIRNDGIDILVDTTMHMNRSKLGVFAMKPAPVQMCWLAYPGTTGLTTIDYRITDPHLDPPGLFDQYYSEESVRLPDTFWCYDPLTSGPHVNGLPAKTNGYITFGCLNNFCKVNVPVLKLWARVLHAVEASRLVILANEGAHRDRTLRRLEAEGITRDRVDFVCHQPREKYLECYHRIDICLDTFPYNGHTTSLDSFWMGVPVVTLVGNTVVGRAGLSQLMNLDLPELIAKTPDDYMRIASELAEDLPRLERLRASLRTTMESSPLMDAKRFTQGMEDIYRRVWERWCDQQSIPAIG